MRLKYDIKGNHGNKMRSTKDDDYYYCYYYYFYSYYSGSNILNNNGTSDHGGIYMYNVKVCPCVHNDCYGMIMDLEEKGLYTNRDDNENKGSNKTNTDNHDYNDRPCTDTNHFSQCELSQVPSSGHVKISQKKTKVNRSNTKPAFLIGESLIFGGTGRGCK